MHKRWAISYWHLMRMLSVTIYYIMLSVVILGLVMLSVVMLSVMVLYFLSNSQYARVFTVRTLQKVIAYPIAFVAAVKPL
jgi:hypothetical protein